MGVFFGIGQIPIDICQFNHIRLQGMKNSKEDKVRRAKKPETEPDDNEKHLRRLEIQKDVLMRIIDPFIKEIQEEKGQEPKVKSGKRKS